MKKLLYFLAGVATTFIVLLCIGTLSNQDSSPYQFFEQPGECINDYKIEVFQALEPGYALAWPKKHGYFADETDYTTVLIYSPEEKPFYDHQVVSIPKGYCARQIGIYKYQSKNRDFNTVPIVQIMEKNSIK